MITLNLDIDKLMEYLRKKAGNNPILNAFVNSLNFKGDNINKPKKKDGESE